MEFIEGINEEFVHSRTIYNAEDKLIFDPPVYEQRYLKVTNILNHDKFKSRIKNILEFGCAEMKFFTYLKNGVRHATKIDLVDIDEMLLVNAKSRVQPLIIEYTKRRPEKLLVRVWKGDVSIPNPNFINVDAVVAIELIEHVYPDTLEEIPNHIFGIIHPKVAVFTTPNSDYNVVFNLQQGAFRHWDHKFEWTRVQFEDWCRNICARFPDYCVQFHGVGKPPEGREEVGSCSQLGLFIRKDFLHSLDVEEDCKNEDDESSVEVVECKGYKLLESIDYPFFHDNRTRDERISDECSYHINRFVDDSYFNNESDRYEIPVSHISSFCWEITDNVDEIRSVIKKKYEVKDDMVILPAFDKSEEDYEDELQDNQESLDTFNELNTSNDSWN